MPEVTGSDDVEEWMMIAEDVKKAEKEKQKAVIAIKTNEKKSTCPPRSRGLIKGDVFMQNIWLFTVFTACALRGSCGRKVPSPEEEVEAAHSYRKGCENLVRSHADGGDIRYHELLGDTM